MSVYRRLFIPGGTYFFTVVTYHRRPILTDPLGRSCLRAAIRSVRAKRPFDVIAFVLMPDHLHAVWTLPLGDSDYAVRWSQIKESFTRLFLASGGMEGSRNAARVRRRERSVWQRRYWEHTCRDDDDLKRCIDYIHWNPVKHGLVERVQDYPWSTFHRFASLGDYDLDTGIVNPPGDTKNFGWE
jgi:putative transposase